MSVAMWGSFFCLLVGVIAAANSGKLGHSAKDGILRHYHIQFGEKGGKFEWVMRSGQREDVTGYFHKLR